MQLKTVHLQMARNKGFPEGSAAHGYAFQAPLDESGHLDLAAWKAHHPKCMVRRFWDGEGEREGVLHHTRGHAWVFSYDGDPEDDEAFFKLDGHVLVPGEYVTIREPDGTAYTFKVTKVS